MVKVRDLPRKAQKAFWAKVGGKYHRVRVPIRKARIKMLRRSKHAQAADMGKTARIVLNPRSNMLHVWMENPEKVDIEGIDTKGSTLEDIRKKLKWTVRREQKETEKTVKKIRKEEQQLEKERMKPHPDQRMIAKHTRAIRSEVRKGLRRRMKAYFDIGRYKKQMAKKIAEEGNMTYLEVVHLINLAPREYNLPSDTIDWYADIDPSLSYYENKAILEEKLQKNGGFDPDRMSSSDIDTLAEIYEQQWQDYVREYAEEDVKTARMALKNPEKYFYSIYGRRPTTEEDKKELEQIKKDMQDYLRVAKQYVDS